MFIKLESLVAQSKIKMKGLAEDSIFNKLYNISFTWTSGGVHTGGFKCNPSIQQWSCSLQIHSRNQRITFFSIFVHKLAFLNKSLQYKDICAYNLLVARYKYTQSLPYTRLQNSRTYGGIIVHKWLQAYNQKVARYQDSFIICFYTSST